jgi:signal peptidase I
MSLRGQSAESNSLWWLELAKVVAQALVLAFLVRMFLFQPFNIPSGSMKSTLLVGDYLFVTKYSYGYSQYSFSIPFIKPYGINLYPGRAFFAREPKRGDVVVFRKPSDPSVDFIKRVIGLPGDTVQMRSGVLYINGQEVPKRPVDSFTDPDCHESYTGLKCTDVRYERFEETLPGGVRHKTLDRERGNTFDNTDVFKVPEGKFFMMGDNRDNSDDSRGSVGFVPFENLIGKAQVIWWSCRETCSMLRPWTWGGIRWSRLFNIVR